MKNDQVREQGLQKLYDKTADKGKIEDLLAVDREFEHRPGPHRRAARSAQAWDKETSYSTVIVKMEQRKDYEPAGTPGFGTTLSRTWEGSLNALAAFGKGLVIVVVAVAHVVGRVSRRHVAVMVLGMAAVQQAAHAHAAGNASNNRSGRDRCAGMMIWRPRPAACGGSF